jgi:hypothetical protein
MMRRCTAGLAKQPSLGGQNMPKYVIERELPGAGSLSVEQLQGIAQKSCSVLSNMGPQIQWIHSYVTGDKIYCIYIAPNEAMVREHATQGGFPATSVTEVKTMIDPTTAETPLTGVARSPATAAV